MPVLGEIARNQVALGVTLLGVTLGISVTVALGVGTLGVWQRIALGILVLAVLLLLIKLLTRGGSGPLGQFALWLINAPPTADA